MRISKSAAAAVLAMAAAAGTGRADDAQTWVDSVRTIQTHADGSKSVHFVAFGDTTDEYDLNYLWPPKIKVSYSDEAGGEIKIRSVETMWSYDEEDIRYFVAEGVYRFPAGALNCSVWLEMRVEDEWGVGVDLDEYYSVWSFTP